MWTSRIVDLIRGVGPAPEAGRDGRWASPPRVPAAPIYQPAWEKKVLRREGAFVWTDPGEPEPPWVPVPDPSPLPARSLHAWSLTTDTVLGYDYVWGDAVCHARVFEAPPLDGETSAPPPVVVLGQFTGHEGRALANALVEVAAAAQARFFPDGRTWRFVQLYPHSRYQGGTAEAPLELREVTFTNRRRRSARERRALQRRDQRIYRHGAPVPPPEEWVFAGDHQGRSLTLEIPDAHRDAVTGAQPEWTWSRRATVRVPALLDDTELEVWPLHQYTAEHVPGPHAPEHHAPGHREAGR